MAKILREESIRQREMQEQIQRDIEERERNSIRVRVIATDHEYGNASYSMDVKGEGEVPLHKPDLLALAAAASSITELWDEIAENLRDEVANRVSLDPVQSSIRLSDHSDTNSDDLSTELTESAKDAIKATLLAEAPERYRQLFGQ